MEVLQDSELMVSFGKKRETQVLRVLTFCLKRVVLELLYANDEHFGCLSNILEKHEPLSMADGWETRRRREPGNDWGVLALSKPAQVEEIIVDTKHFKGNFPHTFSTFYSEYF